MAQRSRSWSPARLALAALLGWLLGCPPQQTDTGADNTDPNTGQTDSDDSSRPDNREPAEWNAPFDFAGVGALSSVWGTSPDNVYIVGGTPEQGEIYHFDGQSWRQMAIPNVPILVWVYGFAPDNILAVGVGGGVLRYDGAEWRKLDAGTTEDLWGVWGPAPDDVWIVGGTVGDGAPALLHFDGVTFTPVGTPANDRNATSLFKVWGIGSKVFAVGERGLIIEYTGGAWAQRPTGADADEDFVSLWGTSEDHIVAVGGRSSARLAVYDGKGWKTSKFAALPGLNAVFIDEADMAVVGGMNGYVAAFDPRTGALTAEQSGTTEAIHAIWGAGDGRYYGVGGRFSRPYRGVALLRSYGDPGSTPSAPTRIPDDGDDDDDVEDCDGDGVADAFAIARGLAPDCDEDGVPDNCQPDEDGDGIPDACDACPGGDDALDADGDGVCDALDICPDGPDDVDADGDGVPDACDPCPAGGDRDGDGVCDAQDLCPDDANKAAPGECGCGSPDIDTDGDGAPDCTDACPLDNPNDSDGDGVCDSDDVCPGGNDKLDTDGDGAPNACDDCDSPNDADGDGVPDDCDICPGNDDTADADRDGVPDGCDACPGADDKRDTDGDGTANGCDRCPGFDDALDGDGDGVPNGCDRCPGFDDALDGDGDGVPNGCDICPGFNDALDSDGDGVPNGCDRCPGFNDALDNDGDGKPNACDPCPNDANDDTDGDGLCDSDDPCPNVHFNNDTDGDCVSNANDVCPGQDDSGQFNCPLGQDLVGGGCVAVARDLEMRTRPVDPNGPFETMYCHDAWRLEAGPQGFTEARVQLRTTGFAVGQEVDFHVHVRRVEDGVDLIPDFTFPIPPTGRLQDTGGGIAGLTEWVAVFFAHPSTVDGKDLHVLFEFIDRNNSANRATLDQIVEASVRP